MYNYWVELCRFAGPTTSKVVAALARQTMQIEPKPLTMNCAAFTENVFDIQCSDSWVVNISNPNWCSRKKGYPPKFTIDQLNQIISAFENSKSKDNLSKFKNALENITPLKKGSTKKYEKTLKGHQKQYPQTHRKTRQKKEKDK